MIPVPPAHQHNPNHNRESHFDLRENLNQNRKNMEGRDTLQEGNKPAEEPQMKETAQPDNSEKTRTNQEQANNSEKK